MNFRAMLDALCPTPHRQRTAIELFARDGAMNTVSWADAFGSVVGVDVSRTYLDQFAVNVPNATTICMDSVAGLKTGHLRKRLQNAAFDLVSADSPQGFYGNGYCEHFDFFSLLPKLSRPGGFFLFNVNLFPYRPCMLNDAKDDYGMTAAQFERWMRIREWIYRGKARLTIEQAVEHYVRKLGKLGCAISAASWHLRPSAMPGHPDHILYLLLKRA